MTYRKGMLVDTGKKQGIERRRDIVAFIQDHFAEHGYAPTVREIGVAVGLTSPATVQVHLRILEEAGVVRRDPTRPRTLQLVDQPVREAA